MKVILMAFLLVLPGTKAISQQTEDSVKAVINLMFTAMNTSDPDLLLSCFADSALLQAIAKDKEGNLIVKNQSVHRLSTQSCAR